MPHAQDRKNLVVAYPPSHPLFADVVTALDDLELPRFVTRIRHLRQITNAYVMHEPRSGLGLLERSCLLLSKIEASP